MRGRSGLWALAPWAACIFPGEAAQDIEGNPVLALGQVDDAIDSPGTYWTELHPCPISCTDTKPEEWTVYPSFKRLGLCREPVLFDFAIYSPVEESSTIKVRACTMGHAEDKVNAVFVAEGTATSQSVSKRASDTCLADATDSKAILQLGRLGSSDSAADDLVTSLERLETRFAEEASCGSSIVFGYANGTIAGVYAGSAIRRSSVSPLLQSIAEDVKVNGASSRMVSQLCDDDRNANHMLGVAVDTTGDLATVRNAIISWADGKCLSDVGATTELPELRISESMAQPSSFTNSTNTTLARHVHEHRALTHLAQHLHRRRECKTIEVAPGDSCGKLATRCGISGADFTEYNSKEDLCAMLQPDQRVCCTEGDLPDITPKKNSDGSCAAYKVKSDDYCAKIAARNDITVEDIEEFNKGTTWGWTGCKTLMAGVNICLSKGDPPMPAPVSNAICGPTKPGSERPKDGTKLEDVSPCPLNACCNIWGQCGISGEFCVKEKGPTGNPGTSPPGVNGCVSSCGMDIVNDGARAGRFGRVGYYESWNFKRPCLNLRAANAVPDPTYTIIHWAFAEINTADWTVRIRDDFNQWEDFKKLPNVRKVISFGGWGYSTEPETYDILRQAMSPQNRRTFALNILSFLEKEGLDGVDFDWEYPGATDIDGTPPGTPSDGPNYLKFLTTVRNILPQGANDGGYTVSIAAPASYWYLKAFPIKQMAKTIDYIVYMTYDLHGQWDAGNQWSIEGCPAGNCLRSHVNLTETTTALSMITKAGVPTNQIYVGESSYGRSFKMARSGCTGPDCTFLGDRLNSQAAKGRCTDTRGYISDAEIFEIVSLGDNVESWHDHASNSDIVVYDGTEWVAHMSPTTKSTRRGLWAGKNFKGTIDWAVDLQHFTDDDIYGLGAQRPDEPVPKPKSKCDGTYATIEDIPADTPAHCTPLYILYALSKELAIAIESYKTVSKGYDDVFGYYVDWVKDGINPALVGFLAPARGEGNKYMDCKWTSKNTQGSGPCTELNFKLPAGPNPGGRTVDFTMRDESGFYEALLSKGGIEKDWIRWVSEWAQVDPCPPCPGHGGDGHCADCGSDYTMFRNFPRTIRDTDKINVPNPKKLIDDAIPRTDELSSLLSQTYEDMKRGVLDAEPEDVVTSFSMPIFMLQDAIQSIKSVKEIGEKQKETKARDLVMNILTIVFSVIPFVGEAAFALGGAAMLARAALIVGEAANIALSIVDIVNDPASAPFAVIGMLIGPAGIKVKGTRLGFKDAAGARRALKNGDLKSFSDKFRSKDKIVQGLLGRSCKI